MPEVPVGVPPSVPLVVRPSRRRDLAWLVYVALVSLAILTSLPAPAEPRYGSGGGRRAGRGHGRLGTGIEKRG